MMVLPSRASFPLHTTRQLSGSRAPPFLLKNEPVLSKGGGNDVGGTLGSVHFSWLLSRAAAQCLPGSRRS